MAFFFTDILAAKVPEEDSKEKSEQVSSTSHSTQDQLNTDSSTTSKENKGKWMCCIKIIKLKKFQSFEYQMHTGNPRWTFLEKKKDRELKMLRIV